MRITKSDGYHKNICDLDDCTRNYCKFHRLLWSSCESLIKGTDGDYANGRAHVFYEFAGCPKCEHEADVRRFEREIGYARP